MIKKAYHYLYYRTYEIILKTNKISPESSSARFLSILFLINILTVYPISLIDTIILLFIFAVYLGLVCLFLM